MQQLCLLPLWRCIYLLLPVPLFYIQIVIPEQMWVFCFFSSFSPCTQFLYGPHILHFPSVLVFHSAPTSGILLPPILCPLLTHAFLLWLITHSAESFPKQTALCNLDWGKLANSSHIGRPIKLDMSHVCTLQSEGRRVLSVPPLLFYFNQTVWMNEWVLSVMHVPSVYFWSACQSFWTAAWNVGHVSLKTNWISWNLKHLEDTVKTHQKSSHLTSQLVLTVTCGHEATFTPVH